MKRKKNKIRPPMSEFFVSKSSSSRIQELNIREDLGGRALSPKDSFSAYALHGRDRGDVETKSFLVEAKQTIKDAYRLSRGVLLKIDREALAAGKVPAVVVEFLTMREGIERQWAVIPYSIFKKVVRFVEEKKVDPRE